MAKIFVSVTNTGDQFVVHDRDGNEITDRRILEELSFMQFSGMQITQLVEVTEPEGPIEMLSPQISLDIKK